MLPAAHQALLTPGSALEEGVLPPWDDGWIVQPDRSIVTPPNAHPDAQVDLWQVAQLESSQGASVFRVTAESIAAALNRGMKPDAIRKLFRTHSRVPLPPTVERLIDDQAKRYGRVKVGTAQTYVQVDDPALLEELRRHSKLKKLEWRDMAPGVAFVVSTDPGTVLTTLRQAGYLPVLEEPTGSRRDTSSKGRVRERDETLRTIRLAIRDDLTLATTWIDRGRPCSAELEPIDLHGRELHALNLDSVDDEELMIPLDAILALSIGEPIDDDFDVQFDDFDDDDFDDEES